MNAKQVLKKLTPLIVILIVSYFFAKALISNWDSLSEFDYSPNALTISGVLLFVLSVISTGYYWGKLINRISSKKIDSFEAIKLQLASWLLKYIPGQAGSVANKIYWGKRNDFSIKVITNSFVYENLLLLTASIILSVPLLVSSLDEYSDNLSIFLPLLLIAPIFLLLSKDIFHRIANMVLRKLKREEMPEEMFLSSKDLLVSQVQFFVPRIVNGLAFVFIAASIFDVTADMIAPLAAAYILAGAIGLVSFFVPSGLGVREAALAVLLAQYFNPEEAIILAIIARFYATIADIVIAGIYLVMNKGKVKQA